MTDTGYQDPLEYLDESRADDDARSAGRHDHEEHRVYGPPGTGKTTFLKNQVEKWGRESGAGTIVVASFTRAAAAEIGTRIGGYLRPNQVGTLHSLAYHAIDRPEIAEKHLTDWNEAHPGYALSTGEKPDLEDAGYGGDRSGTTEGDVIQRDVERLRAQQVPLDLWPASARAFYAAWNTWLGENRLVDFTGMIEEALAEVDAAPNNPTTGLFDEVQDFTPLELDLVRKWGARMDRVVLAGDDDQAIYGFKGATPNAFLDPPVDDDHKRVLRQSYRVPRAVHAAASAWIERVERREPKLYEPRDDDGRVRTMFSANYRAVETVVEEAVAHAEAGRTVMILGTCSMMLDPTKAVLRKLAVPFHNPYRRRRGDWNPLARGGGGRLSATDRLLAYLRSDPSVFDDDEWREWIGTDVRDWVAPLRRTGLFRRGTRDDLEALPTTVEVDPEIIEAALVDDQQGRMGEWLAWSLDWYEEQLLGSRRGAFEYPLAVARARGGKILRERPKIVVGTIHSVKGGEADVVYLFPDLSISGMRQWIGPRSGRDEIVRQFYVGMTRARSELVVPAPASATSVDPRQLLAGAVRSPQDVSDANR